MTGVGVLVAIGVGTSINVDPGEDVNAGKIDVGVGAFSSRVGVAATTQ
ncbi:MAG: hypothetical protein P8186_04075 [Anaerolineae bacterium]|jgi:hypothetical protein